MRCRGRKGGRYPECAGPGAAGSRPRPLWTVRARLSSGVSLALVSAHQSCSCPRLCSVLVRGAVEARRQQAWPHCSLYASIRLPPPTWSPSRPAHTCSQCWTPGHEAVTQRQGLYRAAVLCAILPSLEISAFSRPRKPHPPSRQKPRQASFKRAATVAPPEPPGAAIMSA